MGQVHERIRAHPIWQHMKELGAGIDQAESIEAVDEKAIEAWERIRAVLTFVGKRLAGADPQLVSQATLDSIATHAGGAEGAVRAGRA